MKLLGIAVVLASALAAPPGMAFAQAAGEDPAGTVDATAAAAQTPDCNRVGVRILTDDLNATRLVCRGPAEASHVPPGLDLVETTSAPPTEAPTQFYPLGD